MAWYRTGTVAITNGSTAVVGTGTAFVANVVAGLGIFLPDGRIYEVASVTSNTALTLATPYLGSSGSGQAYQIVPTRGPELGLAQAIAALIQDYGAAFLGAGQGRFGDGTLIAPGMRFTADENTGFHRPANDQIGAVTGGVLRWLLSNTAFQINVPVTGSAVTSNARDTTTGRLVRVGDYGLGTANQLGSGDNLNDLVATGFYYNPTGGNTTGNNYPITSAGSLQVIRETATRCTQRFSAFVPSALATQVRIFERSLGTLGWSPWVEIFHQGSILGAVSQLGGLPTGRLRENVSNANGRAERDFSGSMECWRENLSAANASTALGSRFRSADVTWTFPSAFLAGSTPVVTASVIDADCDVRVVSVSNTQAVFRVISDISKTSAITIQARAKGRWSDMT